MAEYISREAVMFKCNDIWDNADETTQTGVDTINTIDEITDFIESLPSADVQPVNQWISVKDKLPEVGKLVIVCGKQGGVGAMELLSNGKWYSNGMAWSAEWIVYWQPLPEPPKDGDTNG